MEICCRRSSRRMPRGNASKQHGCRHYERHCMLFAPCCNQYFWCRHCHNEIKNSPLMGPNQHVLDRHAVTTVKCAHCGLEQPVAQQCSGCLQSFGKYSCLECNFFDEDTSKRQFHCNMCGICRVGGREHFFHCEQCGCCYQTGLQENHHCVENNMGKPCLMCSENLFDSVKEIITLPCGHATHQRCHSESEFPTCLVCARTAEDDVLTRDILVKASTIIPADLLRCEYVRRYCGPCKQMQDMQYSTLGTWCIQCNALKQ